MRLCVARLFAVIFSVSQFGVAEIFTARFSALEPFEIRLFLTKFLLSDSFSSEVCATFSVTLSNTGPCDTEILQFF